MKQLLLLLLLFTLSSKSQIINAYAKVSSITSGTALAVTNVDQTAHTFVAGEKVIVMQMQDDVIGSNTSNTATFGDLSSISNAGKYEVAIIASRTPASGTPTTINLTSALANTYNTGANSSVQIITFRNLGTNFTTTANITGLAWNGTSGIGGVVAFEVTNNLILNHSISADLLGFKGGAINSNAVAGSCLPSLYMTSSLDEAYKGEGIYRTTNTTYLNGRGHLLSGGGGGNEHNAGGGGGGNYTAGGDGGPGYSCGTSAGGLGGIALSSYISSTRIFLGGGGGGGQQNNTVGLNGSNGGGIVLIKAGTISTNTICSSPIRISANGGTSSNSGNDGTGGGGAGGSIILQVSTFSISSACTLTVAANGGGGGNVGDGAVHGAGGGGGQGAVIYSIAQPTVNMVTSTLNGTGGKNNSSGTSSAAPGSGTSNGGILAQSGPLPIELLNFTGTPVNAYVKLLWNTASELNNDYFTIERSTDGVTFTSIGHVKGAGNSSSIKNYMMYDYSPLEGINYYRLKQTDFNKQFKYSSIISVSFVSDIKFLVFPNPASQDESVSIMLDKTKDTEIELSIYDLTGKQLLVRMVELSSEKETMVQLQNLDLVKGMYIIRFSNSSTNQTRKLVIK